MPWKNAATTMEQVIRFVMIAQSDRFTITELVKDHDVTS